MKLLMILFLAETVYISFGQKNPHFTTGRSTIVHLFEWKWQDIALECESFLGPKGFAGVQISPPSENQIIKNDRVNRPWWERYQPISYNLTTRSGTEEELSDMFKRCNAVGVRVYPDLLINAMAAKSGTGTAGNCCYPSIKFYPSVVYSSDDFNPTCVVNNYNDVYNVRNCELHGLPDLDQSKFSVRRKIKAYIDKLIDLGAAGFRVDAAKHMWPTDLRYIYESVNNLNVAYGFREGSRPYFFQEVPDLGGEAISVNEYIDFGDVLEFKYGVKIGNAFQGNSPLYLLKNFGPAWGLLNDQDAVVFIDNHDNQRLSDTRILSHKKPKNYRAAVVCMLSHPFYIPRVMSSFEFDSHGQGPPMRDDEEIVSPGEAFESRVSTDELLPPPITEFDFNGLCTNGWVCEHRWRQIQNMVKFRNICLGSDLNKWWDNGDNQIAFSRGNKGFIAITIGGAINECIPTSLPPGTYCDIISGDLVENSCSGKSVIVDQDGKAAVSLSDDEEDFMIAVHVGVMTEGRYESVIGSETPIASDIISGTTIQHRINKKNNNNEEEKEKFEGTNGTTKVDEFVPQIRWPDTIVQLYLHLGCLYGLYLCLVSAKLYTTLFALVTIYTSGFGITAGAHRLWSHRAYKASWQLRLLLVFLFTITGQRHVHAWALDHRVHHKYSETDADPHNAKRGFFFSHVGWLVLTPHPNVVEKRKAVDMSDLEADGIVMWQKKYYPPLFLIFNILLPVSIPYYFWGESIWNSFWINFTTRFTITLNIAFFVNSVAHMWGQKPYDKNISPVENLAVSIAALGEGWHNYHHVFPWDYKTGELGNSYNPSTNFINFFAKLGWAYELKSVSKNMILRRAQKTGDGSHPQIWGYGDTDIEKEDMDELENMAEEKTFFENKE